MLTWSKAIIGIDVIDKQAVHEMTTGSYLLLEQDAIILGALQLRVDLPTGQTVTPELLPFFLFPDPTWIFFHNTYWGGIINTSNLLWKIYRQAQSKK